MVQRVLAFFAILTGDFFGQVDGCSFFQKKKDETEAGAS